MKTEDIYVRFTETRFNTSNHELDRMSLKGKDKKKIGLIKDELVEKIIKVFATLRAKTRSYLTVDNNGRKCAIKIRLKSKDHKKCLKAT